MTRGKRPPLQRYPPQERYPLSYSQRGYWYLNCHDTGLWHLFLSRRLLGPLDCSRFGKALQLVVDQHAALRTGFISVRGIPYQIVHDRVLLYLPIVDMVDLAREQVQAHLKRDAVRQESETVFDLKRAPLIAARMYRLAADEHVFFMTVPHIVADDMSVRLMWRQLVALYNELALGRQVRATAAFPYHDYVLWEQAWSLSEDFREQAAFWRQRLSAMPGRRLLPDQAPNGDLLRYTTGKSRAAVESRLYSALQVFGFRNRVPISCLVLAVVAFLLHRMSGEKSIVLAVAFTRRQHERALGSTVGPLAGVSPVVVDVVEGLSFFEYLSAVKAAVYAAYDHQLYPFELISQRLQPGRHGDGSFPLRVMFNALPLHAEEPVMEGVEIVHGPPGLGKMHYDLCVYLLEYPGHAVIEVTYRRDVLNQLTAEGFLNEILVVLGEACRDPASLLGALALSSEAWCRGPGLQTGVGSPAPVERAPRHSLVDSRGVHRPEDAAAGDNAGRAFFGGFCGRQDHEGRTDGSGVRVSRIEQICRDQPLAEVAVTLLGALPVMLKAGLDCRGLLSLWNSGDRADLECGEYESVEDEIERRLLAIWRSLLGVESVSISDNFFDVGGYSLLGLQLLSAVRSVFCIEISVPTFVRCPTIQGLAMEIRRGIDAGGSELGRQRGLSALLIPIREAGSKPPFFLVPGGGGGAEEIFVYSKLDPYLDDERPFYQLLAKGLDGIADFHSCVAEMAEAYIHAIRSVQRKGPYQLGGECIGGVVAFEIARRLKSGGEEVETLVLLDTELPTGSIWNRVRLVALAMLSAASTGGKLQRRWRVRYAKQNYLTRIADYKPRVYDGKLHFIASEEVYSANLFTGWRRYALQGIEVHRVPGDHNSYIRDYCQEVGRRLRLIIEGSGHEDDEGGGRRAAGNIGYQTGSGTGDGGLRSPL